MRVGYDAINLFLPTDLGFQEVSVRANLHPKTERGVREVKVALE